MPPNYFPLDEQAEWVYAVTDPMNSRLVTVSVHPPVEIEVEDIVAPGVRREVAWILRQSDRETLTFAVEREHGVELLEKRRFGQPERHALVVTSDLRWAGDATWTRPVWHYDLQTRRYRRVGDEEVTVTAGRFQCLKILVDDGDSGTIWLAPEVGIVRTVSAIEGLDPQRYTVLELHSWRVPGLPGGPPHCARCGREFRRAENVEGACRYHPGRLRDYNSYGDLGVGAPGDFWDCCMRQVHDEALPQDVPPCASGRHVDTAS